MIGRGVAGSVVVLLGAFLGFAPGTTTILSRGWSQLLVLGGMALLVSAWVALWTRTMRGQADVAAVRRATVAWSLPLVLAPPLFSRDAWSYAAQGLLTHLGLSPYHWPPGFLPVEARPNVDPLWLWTPVPYGPVPLLWGDAAAGVSTDDWFLVVAYRVLALAGLALLAWAVPRIAAACGARPAPAAALVLATPFTLANGVGGVHNDLIMAGVAAVALAVALQHGWFWGAALGGLAAAVKLPGGLVCIAIALLTLPVGARMPQRLVRLASVGGVAVAVLVAAGIPRGLGIEWIHALQVPGAVRTWASLPTLVGGILGHIGLLRTLGSIAAGGIVAVLALRVPTGSVPDAVRALAAGSLAMILLGPVVHGWYFLWVVPFAACLALRRWQEVSLVVAVTVLGATAPLAPNQHLLYLLTSAAACSLVGSALRGRLEGWTSSALARSRSAASGR